MLDLTQLPSKAPEYDLQELLEAGSHFGHQVAKWHPRMKRFIYMEKDGVHIFDLAKTSAQLQQAYNAAYELGKSGKVLLLIGTKRQAKEVVEEVGTAQKVPFVIDVNREKIAIKEANNMGTFTIALTDSNANPDLVDIAIPANDDGRKSIEYVVNAVIAGYVAGKNDKA